MWQFVYSGTDQTVKCGPIITTNIKAKTSFPLTDGNDEPPCCLPGYSKEPSGTLHSLCADDYPWLCETSFDFGCTVRTAIDDICICSIPLYFTWTDAVLWFTLPFVMAAFHCSASLWALIAMILGALILLKNIHPATNAVVEVPRWFPPTTLGQGIQSLVPKLRDGWLELGGSWALFLPWKIGCLLR